MGQRKDFNLPGSLYFQGVNVDDVLPRTVRAVSSGMMQSPVGKMENPVESVNAVAVDLPAENFRKEQSKDPDLAAVFRWLQDQSEPFALELSLASPAVKYYWQHRQQLQMRNGVLYYRWQDPSQDIWKCSSIHQVAGMYPDSGSDCRDCSQGCCGRLHRSRG